MKKYLGSEITHLHSPNIHVCYTAHLDRTFTEAEAKAAAALLARRHPSLAYTVKADESGQKYYDSDGGMETYVQSAVDLLELYRKVDGAGFAWGKSLVKLYILNGESSSDLLLVGHHIIADGLGYLNLFRDTLAALDGRLPADVCAIPENNALVGSKPGFLLGLYASGLNKKWAKQGQTFAEEDYRRFFAEYRKQNIPQVMLGQIGGGFISRLHETCKKQQISVNEAICTAFARAIFAVQERASLRVGAAASTRPAMKIPAPDTLGNFTTGIAVTVGGAEEVTGKLRGKLNDPKIRYQVVQLLGKLSRPLIESVMYAAYSDYDAPVSCQLAETLGERRTDKSVGFTNLGVQDFGSYAFTVSNVQFIGPVFPQNFLTVGVMTVGDTLKFCLRYNTPETGSEEIAAIYDKAVECLELFCH
ncbi:MAG: hypothetical protein LBI54_07010 [Lachnospiraceae bacterium]|jgi:NRPS condensation-like uncharacterized protein|nr:hypothetical protein [Lachnospiraceae bacterium]